MTMTDQEKADEIVHTIMVAEGRNSKDYPLIPQYAVAAVERCLVEGLPIYTARDIMLSIERNREMVKC
jgi:hypothetical protein